MTVLEIAGADLEVVRYGRAGSRPVLLHHGLAGSAALPPQWLELVADADVEIIAIARPGYGLSAPREMADIAAWAPIVGELLDRWALDSVGTLGISAGAPYSYALAASLPDRVARVAITSGLGLVNERETRALYPEPSPTLFEWFGTASFEEVAQFWSKNFSAGLADLPDDHPWRTVIGDSLAHDAAGPAREAILQQRPWGFAVEDVTVPVQLWHTRLDTDVPFATAEIVAARIPGAILHEHDDPAHIPTEKTLHTALTYAAGG
ncbi:alpha/beta fold hydrolase [Millisia brevis]|uniref:alpha/beta fold hydrolase n=1 Tax=Millisia brevis TaxID=264148 RepID=UPI000833390A|nr:alpha/beta fold hydrolase [Millisia brevis]